MAGKLQLTTSAISLMLKEIKAIFKVTNIVIQSLLIVYYGFMIYQNVNKHPIILSAYAVLAFISLIAFLIEYILVSKPDVYEDANSKRNRKMNQRTRKLVFNSIKYVSRISILVMAVVEIVKFGGTDLTIITTILSAILILANIIVDIVTTLANRYILMIKIGFMTDMQESGILTGLIRKFTKNMIDYEEGLGTLNENEERILSQLEEEAGLRDNKKKEIEVIRKEKHRRNKAKKKAKKEK